MDATLEWQGLDPSEAAERLREFRAVLPDYLEDAAEDIAWKIAADASRNAPVDTGRLRASIEAEAERVTEHAAQSIIGSNVEYAPAQEVDQPYLRPAIEQNRDYIRDRVAEAVEAAREEVL